MFLKPVGFDAVIFIDVNYSYMDIDKVNPTGFYPEASGLSGLML